MRASFSLMMLPLVMGACSGSINGTGSDDDPASGGRGTGSGRGSGGETFAACPDDAVDPGPNPIRRLTHTEYNNTVADLLGDTSAPANTFPPESKVHGFDNHVSTQAVTYTLADYSFKAAEKLAENAMGRMDTLLNCDVADKGEKACAEEFIGRFGKRAYRRPLDDEERDALLATYEKGREGGGDFKKGIRFTLTHMLASPYFLYRPEFGEGEAVKGKSFMKLNAWEVASRLSYLFWGTMPDDTLFEAAKNNELSTPDQIKGQVERMLDDPRAKQALRKFYSGWLQLDTLAQSSKDEKDFPGFQAVIPAMMEEIERMMDDLLWNDGTMSQLFTADYTFANKELASFVGMEEANAMNGEFERISLAPKGPPGAAQRMGVLSSPGLLAAHSKPQETSPVLRGLFVLEQILCMEMPLPPPGVAPVEAFDASGLTTRERFEQHAEAACASCHKFIDPIGFAFENFDAAGRYRDTENGKPIKTSGELVDTDVDGPFENAVELSNRLAGSERIRKCLATQWFRYAFGRSETDEHEHALEQLACRFPKDRPIKSMLGDIAQTDAFLYKSID